MTGNCMDQRLANERWLLIGNISETISNAKSLAIVAVNTDLDNFPHFVMNDYWSALQQLIGIAENQCAELVASFEAPNKQECDVMANQKEHE